MITDYQMRELVKQRRAELQADYQKPTRPRA
jgi:hypothetical protein